MSLEEYGIIPYWDLYRKEEKMDDFLEAPITNKDFFELKAQLIKSVEAFKESTQAAFANLTDRTITNTNVFKESLERTMYLELQEMEKKIDKLELALANQAALIGLLEHNIQKLMEKK